MSIFEHNTLLYIVNGIFHRSVYNGKGHRLYLEMVVIITYNYTLDILSLSCPKKNG